MGGLICEKWGATYGRNGCLGGEIKYLVVRDKDDREGFTFKFFFLFFCFRREAERQSPRWGVSLGGVPRVRVFDEAGEKNRLEPEHRIPFGGFSARA